MLGEKTDHYFQPSPTDFEIQDLQTEGLGLGPEIETGTDTVRQPHSEREHSKVHQLVVAQIALGQGTRCLEPAVTDNRRTGLESAIGNMILTADILHTAADSVTGIQSQSVAAHMAVAICTAAEIARYSADCNTRSSAAAERSHSENQSSRSPDAVTAVDCYSILAGCIVHCYHSSDANRKIVETIGPGIRTGHLGGTRFHTVAHGK